MCSAEPGTFVCPSWSAAICAHTGEAHTGEAALTTPQRGELWCADEALGDDDVQAAAAQAKQPPCA